LRVSFTELDVLLHAVEDTSTGIARYFTIQVALTKGNFPAARISIAGLALGMFILVSVIFGIVFAAKQSL
jgi:hypothetical protein